MGARPPRSANQGTGRAGSRGQPARDGPVSHSIVRDPKRMGAAWQGCRTKATDEAASLYPVNAGSGRPENRAPAPSSKCTTPSHLPPFKEEGVNRLHHRGLTHARGGLAPRTPPTISTTTPRLTRAILGVRGGSGVRLGVT